jgi:pimeloyl-ACP methyl ester carboxylesterase
MEEKFSIPTRDGHTIYGTLNYQDIKPTKAVIFVHGLTAHENFHLYHNAARVFPRHGFATIRFNLYDSQKNARALQNCTIAIHAQDINTIVTHFKNQFETLYLVGHSMGGPSILLADTSKINAIVLWDPSHHLSLHTRNPLTYEKKEDHVIIHWHLDIIMGLEMYNEWLNFQDTNILIANITKPIKIICAQKGTLASTSKLYFESANEPKELCIIKGAGHCFDEENTEEELFKETVHWIKKY